MTLERISLLLAAMLLCAASLRAQSFNVDVGEDLTLGSFGTPSNNYPGAAGQTGFWNGLTDGVAGQGTPPTGAGTPWWVANLSDLNGAPTNVSVRAVMAGNSVGDLAFDNFGTFGGHQALYDDVGDVGNTISQALWTIQGLQSGNYEVYVYAFAPDSSAFVTRVSVADTTSADPQTAGGPWPGGHVLGTTYTRHTVPCATGTITITVTTVAGFGSVNGFQLVRTGALDLGAPYCSGDGSGTVCPCGNAGAPGNGCANSTNGNGARLTAVGTASLASDSVELRGSGMPNSSALFFQGTTRVNGGAGVVFGDGLRCAGGSIVRLKVVANAGGSSHYPQAGDPPVSVRGGVNVPGTRTYQVWYRNAASFCTPSTFNPTNGLEIQWF
jgi:hypothetical protein